MGAYRTIRNYEGAEELEIPAGQKIIVKKRIKKSDQNPEGLLGDQVQDN